MAKNFNTPGVYIDEVSGLPASVVPVETAVPAFIGYTEKADKHEETLLMKPTRISSLAEYRDFFGGKYTVPGIEVRLNEQQNFAVHKISFVNNRRYLLYDSLRLFFDNGGGSCYIVSVGDYETAPAYGDENLSPPTGLRGGVKVLEDYDEPTIILFPDAVNVKTDGSDDPGFYALQQMALEQCGKLQDRVAVFDLKENIVGDLQTAVSNFRNNTGINNLKYGAAYTPFIIAAYSRNIPLSSFEENITGLDDAPLALNDLPPDVTGDIKNHIQKELNTLPPGGAIAGIYAKTDRSRGVWKAPANVSLNSVIGPAVAINDQEHADLNVDTVAGKSINAIRYFPGKGTLVWGARTLAGNDNEWRYISVRRFCNMVLESAKKATAAFVFEPNEPGTWVKVQVMLDNFLTGLWRQGALQGATPEQAFYAATGLGRTMTGQDILEGKMNVEVGLAVIRPAEFIIIRIGQKMEAS